MQRITCEIPSNAQQNSRKILPKYQQIASKTLAKILAKHLQNTSKSLAHYQHDAANHQQNTSKKPTNYNKYYKNTIEMLSKLPAKYQPNSSKLLTKYQIKTCKPLAKYYLTTLADYLDKLAKHQQFISKIPSNNEQNDRFSKPQVFAISKKMNCRDCTIFANRNFGSIPPTRPPVPPLLTPDGGLLVCTKIKRFTTLLVINPNSHRLIFS